MRLLPIMDYDNISFSFVNFKRKPTPAEYKHYIPTIKQGLKVLDKELGLIIHNSSAPSKAEQNLGIGSLLSMAVSAFFIPFLTAHGITSIQQEPNYIRRLSDPSPYDPISTSKNIYMIPLEKLASEEYGFLLEAKDLDFLLTQNDERVDYKAIDEKYNKVLEKAYQNWKFLRFDKVKQTALSVEFAEFRSQKWNELEPNALYEVLSKIHQEEDWKKWPEEDKSLYDKPEFAERKERLISDYAKDIDFYFFKQWLVEREITNTNKQNENLGIKIIADTPIAFTPAEEWLYKDLFLKDFALGCPPDYFSKEGQRWGFAVLNPKKIFKSDGNLDKGGEFLKKRYEDIFKASPGGVRIDHLIGLIDPFVYLETEEHMTDANSGRLYSSPHKELLRDYSKFTEAEYAAIFEKIIIPAAEKYGIKKENILCEDLGEKTEPVQKVMKRLGLAGLSVTQYGYSGYDAPKQNVIMLGSHDNQSYIQYTDELFGRASSLGEGRDRFIYKTHILGSDTSIPNEDVNQYRESIRNDKRKFLSASFVELFTSPARKVQIFFTDFFGIGKTYNIPGTKKDCWTLRLNSNYEDLYYENLKKGLAVNLPEAIARAIRQKGTDFSSKYTDLLRKLDYFTHILKS